MPRIGVPELLIICVIAFVAADRSDEERGIADNVAATLAVLESLQVTVHRWPS